MKCIDCEKYIKKIIPGDLKKHKHKIKVERWSETNHGSLEQIENEMKSNRTLHVTPCICGKTYLMMNKILSRAALNNPNRKTRSLTRSPNQNPDYDTEEEVSTYDEFKDCAVLFVDNLEKKTKRCFFFSPAEDVKTMIGIVYHNFFELPLLIRESCNNIFLLEQTAKTVQN